MHVELISLVISAMTVLVLGFLVLLRAYRKSYSWAFAGIVSTVALWALGDLLVLYGGESSIVATGEVLFYVSPILTVFFVVLFSLLFPRQGSHFKLVTSSVFATIAIAVMYLLLQPKLLVSGVSQVHQYNIPIINKGVFLVYGVYLSILFVLSYVILMRRIRNSRGATRVQIRYVYYGILVSSSLALVTNVVLPLFDRGEYIWLGPVFTNIAVGCISYAILRHKLFDIRRVIFRSVGYLLSLVVLATMYGFVVFGAANLLFDLRISLAVQVYISLATAIASLLFGSIKKFFDRQTNRLFYRDAYDAEELFSDVNEVLVSTINLEKLLAGVSRVISSQLKAHDSAVVLRHGLDNNFSLYNSDGERKAFHGKDIERIVSLLAKTGSNTWITDYLPEEQAKLMQLLAKHDISLVSLLTDQKHDKKPIGFIMLKPKKSGNSYTSQDMRVINTVTKELMIAIQNALQFEEIEQFNLTLQHKVEDATKQLRKTNDKLKAMDEAKDDFISMASHQLRTPLTSVKGYISMVLDEDAGKINKMQHKMLDQAFTSAQRMTYLISDLLNVSRLKSGKFVIEPIPVNLAVLVQQEIDQLVETAKVRGLELVFVPPADFPEIMLDETKTRQVIMNFVDNAIYYTPSGGKIEIKLVETERSVELTVVDTGLGVPKHLQHNLFTKFYRAPNAKQARPDGTGLGLFMAKKVIIAQGGATIFKSTENKGSTFGFSFPKNVNQPDHTPPK